MARVKKPVRQCPRWRIVWVLLFSIPAMAEETRPSEEDLFGTQTETSTNADKSDAEEAELLQRDQAQLFGKSTKSKFETGEVLSDPLQIGGRLNLFLQGFWQESRAFEDGAFSAPTLFDLYLDGHTNDRLRGYVGVRLQYDPTRPTEQNSSFSSLNAGTTSAVGLTTSQARNPALLVDQLWLRFDIERRVFLTIGRQKVRWGVSHIWYPTDFLNSKPRDALNPFDVRLGVNMLKVHVPIESLGWNFYGYGLLDAVEVHSSGITIGQLGGALRGEFVFANTELSVSALWQKDRSPRYAIDVSSALGPVDVYAEAAFRNANDFVRFNYPDDLTTDNIIERFESIKAQRNTGLLAQISGGLSWQFNYTESNSAMLIIEYFYNPAGYKDAIGYQVYTFGPSLLNETLDPVQTIPLYGGRHQFAVSLLAAGLPGLNWITVNLSNIVLINDPAALTRVDVIFQVLNDLSLQVFAGFLYGVPGGQLRFQISPKVAADIAQLADIVQPGSGSALKKTLGALEHPPLLQAGVLLRLAI